MAQIKIKAPPSDATLEEICDYLAYLAENLSYVLCNLDEENHTEKYNERTE
ncbi:MAG: hypothetical protein PUB34_06460 [Clostridia bacterium]|nr:hypothetical protein [Clostridia bacterium]